MYSYRHFSFALVFLFVWGIPSVSAQTFGRVGEIQNIGTSYHVFARPGQATIQVIVLGDLNAPGIYEIGVGTDLGTLLALAGGVPFSRSTEYSEQVVHRDVTVTLMRENGGFRQVIYEAPLENMLREREYPALQDNDVFVVTAIERVQHRTTWRTVLQIVTGLVSVGWFIERVITYF